MSLGVPSRLRAIRSTSARWPSAPYDSHCRSVVGFDRTNPGAMLLTVMPHGPSSCASWRVRPICAAFADAYAWMPVRLMPSPAPLEMLMIRPPRCCLHPRRHRLRAVEGAGDVDVEDRLPFVGRNLLERPSHLAEHAAGVVHEDVDAARGRGRRSDAGIDRSAIADVRDRRPTRSARAAAQRFRLAHLVFDDVTRPDVRSALGEGQR